MAKDGVSFDINARDNASGVLGKLQKKSNKAADAFGKMGGSVSSVGFAMGSLTSAAGASVSAVGNLAANFATTGVLGVAITGATLGIAKFIEHMGELKKKEEELRSARLKESNDWWKTWRDVSKGIDESIASLDESTDKTLQRRAKSEMDRLQYLKDNAEAQIREYEEKHMEAIDRADEHMKRRGRKDAERASFISEDDWKYLDDYKHMLKEADEIGKRMQLLLQVEMDSKNLERARRKRDRKAKAAGSGGKTKSAGRSHFSGNAGDMLALGASVGNPLAAIEQYIKKSKEYDALLSNINGEQRRREAEKTREHERELARLQKEAEAREKEHARQMQRQEEEQRAKEMAQRVGMANMAADASHFAFSQVQMATQLYGQMEAARRAGNEELLAQLQQQEDQLASRILLNTLTYIGEIAVAKGTAMAIEGAARRDWGLLAGGVALASFGGGAVLGAGVGGALLDGRMAQVDGVDVDKVAAKSSQAIGTDNSKQTSGPAQQVYNFYLGGPVFGDVNSAAKAVVGLHDRGLQLEGR